MASDPIWWGTWKLSEGEARRWRVGPATAWVQRLASEWRIATSTGDDPLDGSLEVAAASEPSEFEDAPSLERFVRRAANDSLLLTPALADRPIVTRPVSPFTILPADDVRLLVSSPLWLRFEVDPPRQLLRELPSLRPSDTWFGPSTQTGELCYAARTHCRLDLGELPFRPHRAITTVHLRNQASSPLPLSRLSVPVPHLSLFRDAEGRLWTESITIDREDADQELARLRIEERPPDGLRGVERVSEPRRRASNGWIRAFGALF